MLTPWKTDRIDSTALHYPVDLEISTENFNFVPWDIHICSPADVAAHFAVPVVVATFVDRKE